MLNEKVEAKIASSTLLKEHSDFILNADKIKQGEYFKWLLEAPEFDILEWIVYEKAFGKAIESGKDNENAAMLASKAVETARENTPAEKMLMSDMLFTKAIKDDEGIMKWSAVVSKFEPDIQDDEVTPEFYESATKKIKAGLHPTPPLCVSHIDLGQQSDDWVAGDTSTLYVDGKLPKAKGTFRDTPLGIAAFDSVQKDIKDDLPMEQRIRISMGFYSQKSTPRNTGETIEDGWIKHFAMTRVPVVSSTVIDVDGPTHLKSKARSVTVSDDAISIVGQELAKQLLQKATETKEKGLVEKATSSEENELTPEQIKSLIAQLQSLLPDMTNKDEDIVQDNLATQGISGTAPKKAQEAKKSMEFVDVFAMSLKACLDEETLSLEKVNTLFAGLGEAIQPFVKKEKSNEGGNSDKGYQEVLTELKALKEEIISVKAELVAKSDNDKVSTKPSSMDGRVVVKSKSTNQQPAGPLSAKEMALRSVRGY